MGQDDTEGTLAPFGATTAPMMTVSRTEQGRFHDWRLQPVAPLALHPTSHALHYGSACFEGLKAHRGPDGVVRLFRPADHVRRMRNSAAALCLPVPPGELLSTMIHATAVANLDQVPQPPGALYLRPALIGVDENIGAATRPSADALLFVIASPGGEYFGSDRPLTVLLETAQPRSTPQFGSVKSGANYAMALGATMRARAEHDADQVLFAPGGLVQETGASNFLLLDEHRVVTRALDNSFLHGVTRASVLTLAAELGYEVEERDVDVDELLAWIGRGELALVGTAAVLAGVGTLVVDGTAIRVGDGTVGPTTRRLRDALVRVQRGQAPDLWNWTVPIDATTTEGLVH